MFGALLREGLSRRVGSTLNPRPQTDSKQIKTKPPHSKPNKTKPLNAGLVEMEARASVTLKVSPKPEIRNSKPSTLNSKPETRNPKPETRHPKPDTRRPTPETRNPRPETRSPTTETRNPKPETRRAHPAPGAHLPTGSIVKMDLARNRGQVRNSGNFPKNRHLCYLRHGFIPKLHPPPIR